VGAGSDEMIMLTTKAFALNSQGMMTVSPTYSLYEIVSSHYGIPFVNVSRGDQFGFPLEEACQAARHAAVNWLCVPSNPLGLRDSDQDIEALLESTDGIVVIDAAYAEYSGDFWADWVDRHPNLIVLRTLSKAFALAGIRVGYSISSESNTLRLEAVRPPGSISILSNQIAVRALTHREDMQKRVKQAHIEIRQWEKEFRALGFTILQSSTNFLLSHVGPHARQIAQTLMWEKGMVVRSFKEGSQLEEYLRMSNRNPEDNERLTQSLKQLL
ncbi:MAG TPA: histidinol-phosphate aminotransferase family protein, partial [Myxococcales bacterium]|nr:histidinol-phosphate aminotransferase family protein [Myxococcales bacterium]